MLQWSDETVWQVKFNVSRYYINFILVCFLGSWIMFAFFLNIIFSWFKYVCNKTLACNISARFHSLTKCLETKTTKTEKSQDQNGWDWICQTKNSCFDIRFAISEEIAQYHQIISLIWLYYWFSAVIFKLGVVNFFGECTGRYFMYTAVLHLLYSSLKWGC